MDQPTLCLLGQGEINLEELCALLQVNKTVYLIDTELEISAFPQSNHPGLQIRVIKNLVQEELFAQEIAWCSVMQALTIRASSSWERMRQRIEEHRETAHLLLSETADFGVEAFYNAMVNWKTHGPFYSFEALKDKFFEIPAIVCGAGPSLCEALPLLRSFSSHALLFAAGSAWPIFSEYNLEPHVGFALDKQMPVESFLKIFPFSSPCCIQSRLNPGCMALLHEKKILFPENGPLPWENWWLGHWTEQEAGWTVGNLATRAAVAMGCNPIIWVGMDFCYQNEQKYAAPGVHSLETLLTIQNGLKETVLTQRDWLAAARWSQSLAAQYPKIRFINTSQRGLLIEQPIQTVPVSTISTYLMRERDIQGHLHRVLQSAPEITPCRDKWAEWELSVGRCLNYCHLFDGKKLEKEVVYQAYLDPLWTIWRPLFERETPDQNLELHRLLFFQNVLHSLINKLK
jgi:hypothetical protein